MRKPLLTLPLLAFAGLASAQETDTQVPFGGLVPPGISTSSPGGVGFSTAPVTSTGTATSTGTFMPAGGNPGGVPPGGLLNTPPNSGTGGSLLNSPGSVVPTSPQYQQPGPQFQQPTAPITTPPAQSFVRPPVRADAPKILSEVEAALRALDREKAARSLAVKAEFEERRARLSESPDWSLATSKERRARLKVLKKEALERERLIEEEHRAVRRGLEAVRAGLEKAIGR